MAWRWMNVFADEWSCYWVLASGSLCRFWEIAEISQNRTRSVPELVSNELRMRLQVYERDRVTYKCDLIPKSIDEFIKWINTFTGPRLVVLNTVQSAAVLAEAYRIRFGRSCVEHLSTALTPCDRETTLLKVKRRLENKKCDADWVLFATSCAEAGVNLSFRNGFRELGSLVSLLQMGGRVNREGEERVAEVWTFILKEDKRLKQNSDLKNAARVLRSYFENGEEIIPSLSTQSIFRLISEIG
jgi:CRISPR/Cas system-associated endonuclease/helicase Cas3